MADENKVQAEIAAESPAKVAEMVANTAEKVVKESAAVAKRERAKVSRRAKRQAVTEKKATRRVARKTRTAARKTARVAQERIETVTNNYFNGFDAVPAFAPFQSLFADANDRGQAFAKKSQKVAEELAELTKANVEAMVEAGRVAAEGARSLSQDVIATGRDNVEQAADAVRSLAEAKSPTEYLQLQSDFARASFDRAVAETSKLTETLVKLAGEAFQPISNRATANAERFNTLVA